MFSIFSKNAKYDPNPPIYENTTRAITAGFKFDFRDYIEDGFYRRRVNLNRSRITIEGEITHSDKNFLKSTNNFNTYKSWVEGSIATFNFSEFDFKLFGMYNTNNLPYQMFFSIPGSVDFLFNSFGYS